MNRGVLLMARPYGAFESASIRSECRSGNFHYSTRFQTTGHDFFNKTLKEFPVSKASRHLPKAVSLVFHKRQPQGEEGRYRRAGESAKSETAV